VRRFLDPRVHPVISSRSTTRPPCRGQVTPGTSALFVLTSEAVMDKVHGAFEGESPELIFTNLSSEEEETLRSVFADA
jgi:uncharacterized membrane protein